MHYDVFISYRHSRKSEVIAFCERLSDAGISFFRDEERRNENDLLQRGIEEGIACCKLMLAWFDPTYLDSRACAWELGRALMAARQQGDAFSYALERIVCVDPTGSYSHVPEEIWDRTRVLDGQNQSACISHVLAQLTKVNGTFGSVPAESTGNWYERECPRHPTWVGRESELIRIFAQLCRGEIAMKGDERAPVAITGQGGEGKTMLAEQYAIRHASAYPGGVVWMKLSAFDGSGPAEEWLKLLEHELLQIAIGAKLKIPGKTVRQAIRDVVDLRQRVRILKRLIEDRLAVGAKSSSQASRGTYLWVVDDLPSISREDLLIWAPNSSHVHCLVTMRGAVAGPMFREIELRRLAKSHALKILTSHRPPISEVEAEAAVKIVELLGRLPLALELAGAAVDTYSGLYEHLLLPLDEGLEPLFEELKGALPTLHANSIVKTFDRSLGLLEGANEVATRSKGEAVWTLLRTAALLSPAPLPDALALKIHREMGFPVGWFQLCVIRAKAGAILQRPGPADRPCSQMHALLSRTVIETRISETQRTVLFEAINRATAQWMKEESSKNPFAVDTRIFSTSISLLRKSDSLQSASVAHELGDFAYEIGMVRDALECHEHSLAIRQKRLGAIDPLTVDALEGAAVARMTLRDLKLAKPMLEEVVSLRLARVGSRDRLTLRALSQLAVALHMLGEFDAAKERQEWVLQCWQEIDSLSAEALGCASNLALTLESLGELSRAAELHLQTWKSRRLLLHSEHPDVLDSLQHLALLDLRLGHLQAAQTRFHVLRKAHDRFSGPSSPASLSVRHNLAVLWRRRGKLCAAFGLMERTVEQLRVSLGNEHPATLSARHELAEVLLARGESKLAVELLEPLLEARQFVLGRDNFNTQNSMAALARGYFVEGQLARARALQEHLLESELKKPLLADSSRMHDLIIQLSRTVQLQDDMDRLSELKSLLSQLVESSS